MKRVIALLGLTGMILIQGATIPAIIGSMSGGGLPPVTMVLQSILALSLLTAHSYYNGFKLYTIGNIFGLVAQTITLLLILKA